MTSLASHTRPPRKGSVAKSRAKMESRESILTGASQPLMCTNYVPSPKSEFRARLNWPEPTFDYPKEI